MLFLGFIYHFDDGDVECEMCERNRGLDRNEQAEKAEVCFRGQEEDGMYVGGCGESK
jgi:hypothetical protein